MEKPAHNKQVFSMQKMAISCYFIGFSDIINSIATYNN